MIDVILESQAYEKVTRLISRFFYPVSLPEELAHDLGFSVSNFIRFDDFLSKLTSPCYKVSRLYKLMPRTQAERVFSNAFRKQSFHKDSLYAYCFKQGWIEFVLQFDENDCLRRVYMQHPDIPYDHGWEMALSSQEASK